MQSDERERSVESEDLEDNKEGYELKLVLHRFWFADGIQKRSFGSLLVKVMKLANQIIEDLGGDSVYVYINVNVKCI